MFSSVLDVTVQRDCDSGSRYTPWLTYIGSDTFVYALSDGVAEQSATVVVEVYKTASEASGETFRVLHNLTLSGLLSGNELNREAISALVANGPSHGALTFDSDHTFTYTPNTHYVGANSFTYTWSDDLTTGNTATVSIDVYNNAPVAEDDTFVIPRNGQLSLGPSGILENDLDSDGDPLRVSSVIGFQWESATPLASGEYQFTTEVNPDGSLLVVRPADWSGVIRLLYAVSDGVEESYAWVTVYVGDEPILRTDYYVVPEDGILDIVSPSEGVLANDEDRLGRTWEARLVPESAPAPEIGEVTLRADGTFTFIAGPEWTCCSDTHFAYTVAPAVAIVVVAFVILVGQGCRSAPPPPAAPAPLIDWVSATDTGKVLTGTIYGDLRLYTVRLAGGVAVIEVAKRTGGPVAPGTDPRYNCHGYTFGGSTAPGGPFPINNDQVPTILKHGYDAIGESDVKPGDIAVFWLGGEAVHSAVVKEVRRTPSGSLDPSGTTFKTKNGTRRLVDGMPLEKLRDVYPKTTITYYRRK
jgi:hypothetical protein